MSFAEWMAATPSVSSADTSLEEGGRGRTDEAGAEIRMHEAQTVGEAADALLKGRYDQIEGTGKDELDRMLAESGNARRMIGTLTEADSQRIILGNDMADAVTYGNIAAQGQAAEARKAGVVATVLPMSKNMKHQIELLEAEGFTKFEKIYE